MIMIDADMVGAVVDGCRARPIVTRRGWREDVLCASAAIVRGRRLDACHVSPAIAGALGYARAKPDGGAIVE
jgi:hypothetical protein